MLDRLVPAGIHLQIRRADAAVFLIIDARRRRPL
jgi:hypothetical protein